MERNEIKPTNWNAGQEFNKIIGENKLDYQYFHIAREWKTALDILSIDFDISYIKIISEAKKHGKDTDTKNIATKIRRYIKETDDFIQHKKRFPKYDYEASRRLSIIRRKIWDLQGQFGVLYPFNETKKRNPGDAIKDGFS